MPARKSPATKKSAGKKASAAASIRNGPLPPYGIAIRDAVSRGNAQEMRAVAVSARKYLKDVQSALDKLEKSISPKR
jgi:hypothetical protein